MTENVQTEVAPDAKVSHSVPDTNSAAPNQATETQETEQQIHWKKFRENRAKEREEAALMAKKAAEKEAEANALKAALEAAVSRVVPQQQYQQNEQPEESEQQRIDRLVNEAVARREAQAEEKRQQTEVQEYPKKLESTFKDFNVVCSSENLDYLEYHHPELARSLGSRPQSFEKWADIYNAVKRYIPNPDAKKDIAKAEKNLQKPQSMSGTGMATGPSGMQPSRLDRDRKQANWERMQKALKGIS